MLYKFVINKHVPASASNVIANYLDLDHVPSHSKLSNCRVISETDRTACFLLTSRIGPFSFRNVHFFEYRPPFQILQVVKTVLGPMTVLATTEQQAKGGAPSCIVRVEVELELPRIVYFFRTLIRYVLELADKKVLAEDNRILERRQRLFGDCVDDYLHPENKMLFKELFRKHFANLPAATAR